jgi:RNA polymerase sigma factor (sigma-70 family)
MTKGASSTILQLIRRVAPDERVRQLSDHELLRRFAGQGDEAAFHALLLRHGPMVLEVCHGVLGNEADGEDAFQATFLILARKASSIRKTESLGSWLHGVAYRTAVKARTQSATRRKNEACAPARANAEPDDLTWREVRQVLHEELTGLAERYRAPLVACYLEGKTQDEAAAQLGVAKTTLKERLERARSMLRARLVRRGLGPAAVLVATAWPSATASACLSETLVASTIKAACLFAAARTVTAAASANVATLAEGVMKAMFLSKMKTALVVIVTVLGLGTGVGLMIGVSVNPVEAQEAKGKALPTEAAKLRVQELIQQLNADKFKNREQATKVLKELGKEIVPQLEAALKTTESAEIRRRLEQLLAPYRPQTDLAKLHGAWTLVEMEIRGKKRTGKDMIYPLDSGDLALKEPLKLFIDGQNIPRDRLIPADQVKDANDRLGGVDLQYSDLKPEKGDFLLNETKKPKRIAMAWFVRHWESIYKLDGDTLTICFNPKNCIRPDDFRTAADSDQVIFVFKREKPAQDKKGRGVDKRPELSGIQFVPETKKPAGAQETTDPSTPDVRALRGHSAAVYFAAFSPNGKTLVTAAKGFTKTPRADELIIWDVTAQKAKHKIRFQAPADIWSMTLSPDGKTVAVGTPVGIELRDAETGKTKRTLEGPWAKSTGPFCLAFAPDGKTLAVGGSARDNIVRLWDVQTGKLTGTLKGHKDAVVGLRFLPDGKTLTSTSGRYDTTVRYWNVATGELRSTVRRAQEKSKDGTEAVDGDWQTWPAAFSPDGKILARGRGAEVKFWDAQTGEVRDRVIEGSHAYNRLVQSLAFSPDGKLVAGGRDSGEIDVWETRPADGKHDWRIGDLKQTFKKEHSHPVMALAFSPSGDLLASGDQDGMVRVWKMTKK